MFDMGLMEILLIGVIALIVVGPERLPRLARTAGLWIGKARSMVASVRDEVERELKVEELKRSIKQQTDTEEFRDLADQVKSVKSDLRNTGQTLRSDIDHGTQQVGDKLKPPSGSDSITSRTPADPASETPGVAPSSEPTVSAEQSPVPPATPRQSGESTEADAAVTSTHRKSG